jgi:hypothetical protein
VIVRILGEGQYELPDTARANLDGLDAALDRAVDAKDDAAFRDALEALINSVRDGGTALEPSRIVPSDLALPPSGSSLGEVLDLLSNESLEA